MCCNSIENRKEEFGDPVAFDLSAIKGMKFFDPHVHMTSRTTDDYQAMADAGIVALIEPAFWLGQPRTGIDSFRDYYSSLIGWERFRSSQFGIKHYCTIGLNSREANNEALAEQVMEILVLMTKLPPRKNTIACNWNWQRKPAYPYRSILRTVIKRRAPNAVWI